VIRRFLRWLTARLPVKVIGRDAPYVEWYYICTLPIFGGVRVQLHRFVRSDPDGVHDHPWGWARTFILTSWYFEQRRDGTRIRSAGQTYGLTGDTFHRVVLPEGGECWTLFFHGPYVKSWGFLQPVVWDTGSDGELVMPSWRELNGRKWIYRARDRDPRAFDDWHLTAPKGRELREAA
jgi:hypothetical protein